MTAVPALLCFGLWVARLPCDSPVRSLAVVLMPIVHPPFPYLDFKNEGEDLRRAILGLRFRFRTAGDCDGSRKFEMRRVHRVVEQFLGPWVQGSRVLGVSGLRGIRLRMQGLGILFCNGFAAKAKALNFAFRSSVCGRKRGRG